MLSQGLHSFLSPCFLIVVRWASFVCHALPSLGVCSFSSQAQKQWHRTETSETMSQNNFVLFKFIFSGLLSQRQKAAPTEGEQTALHNLETGAGGGRFWLEINSVSMALGRWFNYSVSQLHACKMRVIIRVLSQVWELNEIGFKNLV